MILRQHDLKSRVRHDVIDLVRAVDHAELPVILRANQVVDAVAAPDRGAVRDRIERRQEPCFIEHEEHRAFTLHRFAREHFHTRHFNEHPGHRGEGGHVVLRHDDIEASRLAAGAAQIAQREVASRGDGGNR